MKISKILQQLSVLLIGIVIMYTSFLSYLIGFNQNVLWGLSILAVGCFVADIVINKRNLNVFFNMPIILFLVYALYSLVIGIVIALDIQDLMKSIFTYLCFYIFMCIVYYNTIIEKQAKNTLRLIYLTGILSCLSILITGGYSEKMIDKRYVVGPGQNPNDLGLLLVYSNFYALNYLKSSAIKILSVAITGYNIFLTGSRKSLIAAIVLLISKGKKFINIRNIIVIIFAVYFCLYSINNQSNYSMINRIAFLFSQGDPGRLGMYEEAWNFFLDNPIFGIGYNQFWVSSMFRTYSHSTYAEVLSCGGIIGSLLYFVPFFYVGIKLLKNLIYSNYKDPLSKEGLEIFSVMFFLSFSVIHPYDLLSHVMLGVMIGYIELFNQKNI